MAVTGWTKLDGAADCPTRSLSGDRPRTRHGEIGHEHFLIHLSWGRRFEA